MNVMPADSSGARSRIKYDRLIAAAQAVPPVPTIVVHPCDETSLRGVVDSAVAGIIRPVLVGPEKKIRDTASKCGLDISGFEIVDAAHSEEAAAKGVELIHAAKRRNAHEGQPAHRRTDAERHGEDRGLADRPAHQPRVRDGCTGLRRNPVCNGRGHQHLSRSRCQARYYPERH